MLAGLTAGGIAATLAILLSLPLVSPHDGIFNAASVALAGLLIILLNALLWPLTAGRQNPPRLARYALLWLILAVALTAIALYLMSANQLENYLAFTLTLAAILFGVTAAGTILLRRYVPQLPWWSAPILIAIALTLGWTLREIGDQPSGQLELPPPASHLAPANSELVAFLTVIPVTPTVIPVPTGIQKYPVSKQHLFPSYPEPPNYA